MTQEFKTARAEQYANGKSSASVFRENHIKDYLAGYEQALEDVQEQIDQSETFQKGFVALQEAVLKSAERNKELVEMLEKVLEVNKHHNFNGHRVNEQIERILNKQS